MRSGLERAQVEGKVRDIVAAMFAIIPTGVGGRGQVRLPPQELRRVMTEGARWAVHNGYGLAHDLERIEEGGRYPWADPAHVSDRAIERGKAQLGTLGSGNHFVEIQVVDQVFDEQLAAALDLRVDQVCVMIHSGSRGFGHQVCDDYLHRLQAHLRTLDFTLPDRQLACAYFGSDMGQAYFRAMACAVNYAFCNRQIIGHWVREAFMKALSLGPRELDLELIYDVAHNVAKPEEHVVDGQPRRLVVHRKGATRAFPPGHPEIPERYRAIGQPVLIPGDMGRCSYLLVGTAQGMTETWGSTCHGAGRTMSRSRAMKVAKGRAIDKELEQRGIFVMAAARGTLAEEMSEAYKDVSRVVEVVHEAGISRKVALLRPIGNIKG